MGQKNGTNPPPLETLEDRLGHQFQDRELLIEALTHASFSATQREKTSALDYERLEFLGDRVLGLVVADILVRRFPKEKEGGLAPRLNALVRKDTLAEIARDLELEKFLRIGQGENRLVQDRSLKAIVADACEAVIGALYLDGGLAPADAFIKKYWDGRVASLDEIPRDAKTSLQEWAQARGLAPPVYELVKRMGPDHAPQFVMKAVLSGLPHAEAKGTSKRSAEQAAAEAMLREAGIWSDKGGTQ